MRESNIEFAEGHKYQLYSATQIQPNDTRLNRGCQRCHSPSMTTVTAFFFFHPDCFSKGGYLLTWGVTTLHSRKMHEGWGDFVETQFVRVLPVLGWVSHLGNWGTSNSTVFSFFPADPSSCSKAVTLSYLIRVRASISYSSMEPMSGFFQIHEKTLCLLNTIPLN